MVKKGNVPWNKGKSTIIEKDSKCVICDKTFKKKSNSNKKTCCCKCRSVLSWDKRETVLKEKRKCLICNKVFIVRISSKKVFCSKQCSNKGQSRTNLWIKGHSAWNKDKTRETDRKINECEVKRQKTMIKKYGRLWFCGGYWKGMTKKDHPHLMRVSERTKERNLKDVAKLRERMIKLHAEGKLLKITNTLPHRLLRKAMQDNNLWNGFQDEYPERFTSIDIANPEKKIAIYVDGNYWHNYPFGKNQDKKVTKALTTMGWKVLRFWESDIKLNVVKCLDNISATI